ncbi:hypothetical protein Pint_17082 [Pistacia integerrima]|uniref:Uncharacterized protein n=1 Tax=Pistacia integerrima TaxID=434235 RepID=A0ACC0ZAF7_9ROSI|nr:hypothetical protein Pint_17082 [Pistacia integerrima]
MDFVLPVVMLSADILQRPISPEMVVFYITQDTQKHPLLPELKTGGFKVTGKVSTQCSLVDPINGELTVEASSVPIQSIDLHLLQVESILLGEKIVTETSLIQTTQIADGDVCRKMTLPIYVILPRLLTCPTVFAGWPWRLYHLNLSEQSETICAKQGQSYLFIKLIKTTILNRHKGTMQIHFSCALFWKFVSRIAVCV